MNTRQLRFDAIGTKWQIQFHDSLEENEFNLLERHITARIAEFDAIYSRFRPDSLVTAMSKNPGLYALPPDGFPLLRFYEQLYGATDGLVTPFIGQAMADAGYDANYSFKQKPLVSPPKWENTITYDTNGIHLEKPVLLDFGAAGKGYLVDIIANLIEEAGMHNFVINAGGDILHRADSNESVTIGLENPLDDTEVIGTITLCNQSLCASSSTKRKWQNMHHILNPATLQPVEDTVATWVVADNTMLADGLATALFFVEPIRLRKMFSFSYATLNKNMGLEHSTDLPIKLFEATHA